MALSIIHLDMDAFYAAVEQRDNPALRGRPVIVGGSPKRGVVCACSYESRPFGVRSAMPMSQALRLCPEAVVLPVRMHRYQEVSRQVFAIFARYTDRVEPLSVDEAFLDVSGCERLFGTAPQIALLIRREVRQETGLAVSAGVAANKFLAKLASESAKPDGIVVLEPKSVEAFLNPLPVSRLWGVGKKTGDRLAKLGCRTVADLRCFSRQEMMRLFGQWGDRLYLLARGVDERPVETEREAKSIGAEETYETDLTVVDEIHRKLLVLAERTSRRLRREGLTGEVVTLKVRYGDFETVTRRKKLGNPSAGESLIFSEARHLLARTEAGRRPVRLLGISVSELKAAVEGQQGLFGNAEERRRERLDRSVDELVGRFGADGIRKGTLLEKPSVEKGSDTSKGS